MMTDYEMEMYVRSYEVARRQEAEISQKLKEAMAPCDQRPNLNLATKLKKLFGGGEDWAQEKVCPAAA